MAFTLPWWGGAYLSLIVVVYLASFGVKKRFYVRDAFDALMSIFCLCVFVIAYFNGAVAAFFGYLLIPMTAIGLLAEHARAEDEMVQARMMLRDEGDLSEEEERFVMHSAQILNALLILPGYGAGLYLSLSILGLM